MPGPNSDNHIPVAVSIKGKPAVLCYGFVPEPDLEGVECFDSNNDGLAPGVETEEQYRTDTSVLVLMGEICIYCANQACENKQRFNPESKTVDIEEG